MWMEYIHEEIWSVFCLLHVPKGIAIGWMMTGLPWHLIHDPTSPCTRPGDFLPLVHLTKLQCLLWCRNKGGGGGRCVCVCVYLWVCMCEWLDMCDVCVSLWKCELCSSVNIFARCCESENPFLYKNRIVFLRQKYWVSRRMALSFRRSFQKLEQETCSWYWEIEGEMHRPTVFCISTSVDPLALPMHI